jgi:hypothetical protein
LVDECKRCVGSCSLRPQGFEGTCGLHLQGTVKMEAVGFFEKLVAITSQKNVIMLFTAVNSSNFTE